MLNNPQTRGESEQDDSVYVRDVWWCLCKCRVFVFNEFLNGFVTDSQGGQPFELWHLQKVESCKSRREASFSYSSSTSVFFLLAMFRITSTTFSHTSIYFCIVWYLCLKSSSLLHLPEQSTVHKFNVYDLTFCFLCDISETIIIHFSSFFYIFTRKLLLN